MTPFTTETAGAAGARGGSRMTEAKRAALRALHASRRGQKVNPYSPAVALANALLATGTASARALAAEAGVPDRTLRRWLAGTHHPAPERAAELISAVVRLRKRE